MPKHLIMSISGKGGVGKTTSIRALAEILRQHLRAQGLLLVDGNGSVGQFLRYLGVRDDNGKLRDPQPEGGVRVFSLHGDERDRDQLLELLATGAEVIVVDLPAESLGILQRIETELGFLALVEERGYELTLVSPLTPYHASVRDAKDALDFSPSGRHVIVRNMAFGDPDDFAIWDSSKTKRIAEEHDALITDLPRLKARIMATLDRDSLSFADGVSSPSLALADQRRLQLWLAQVREAFAPLVERIAEVRA